MLRTIMVTRKDIDNGKKENCKFCPVALAISRVLPKGYEVNVHFNFYEIYDECNRKVVSTFITNMDALNFIYNFDSNKEVKPFSFELNF